jgi:hypothetical protein
MKSLSVEELAAQIASGSGVHILDARRCGPQPIDHPRDEEKNGEEFHLPRGIGGRRRRAPGAA